MAKKIFYFSLSLFVLILILLGAYNFAFKNNVNNPIADPAKIVPEQEGIPLAGEEKIANIINEEILGPIVSEDGSLYYYSESEQVLKKATLEGKNKTVLMSNLPGMVTRILWSPTEDQALLLIKQTSGELLWHLATLSNKSLTPLKAEMGRLAWDNLGGKIYYQYTDPVTKNRSLNSANPDGTQWKKLTDLGMEDFFLTSIPRSSAVSFWNRPNAKQTSSLNSVGAVGENRHSLFGGVFGGDYSWSSNGETVLISGSDDANGNGFSLRIMKGSDPAQTLALPTIISKTVWSKDGRTLYYTLPGALPKDAVLPDDYFEKPLYTKDTFWKVDTATGKKTRLIELRANTKSFDSSDLFLSPQEDSLFFTDRVSKRLYRIEL